MQFYKRSVAEQPAGDPLSVRGDWLGISADNSDQLAAVSQSLNY